MGLLLSFILLVGSLKIFRLLFCIKKAVRQKRFDSARHCKTKKSHAVQHCCTTTNGGKTMENIKAIFTSCKTQQSQQPKKINTKQMVGMAMLAAVSIVFVSIIHFPLFPAAAFLEYDPADIPILIGAFAYGPGAGFLLAVVVSCIQGATVSAGSGVIGIVMHIAATGSCALICGSIYQKTKTKKGAAAALALGAFTMTAAMVLMNLILTPLFMGAPIETVMKMLVPVIIPFNLLKSAINCLITFLLYQSISHILREVGK